MPHQIIIRYCPDIVVGECVNIGVAVYDMDSMTVVCAFIEDTQRMAAFFGLAPRIAYKIVDSIQDESLHWTPLILAEACKQDFGSYIFSGPYGTTLTAPEALADAVSRYLHRPQD